MGRTAIAAALLVLGACGDATGPPPIEIGRAEGDGVLGSWVHSGLHNRTYTLHVPAGTGAAPQPLLILLHGAGDTGASFRARLSADAATDAAGLITVYPDGLGGTWSVGCRCTPAELAGANDVIFLATLVRHLARELPVDTTRVYVAGFSQGGQLAQRYGCTSVTPPAGVASVAASLFREVADHCDPTRAFPTILIHGDEDPVMRYEGFGPDANVLSAEETRDAWLRALHCGASPAVEEIRDDNQDGTSVTVARFGRCDGGDVAFLRIRGGGHTWPGKTGPWPKSTGKLSRNLDGTRQILDFFAAESGT